MDAETPSPLQRFPGEPGVLPPEIEDLGTPESVHPQADPGRWLRERWWWFAITGGLLSLLPIGIAVYRLMQPDGLSSPAEYYVYGGGLVLCLILMAAPTLATKPGRASYWLFPDRVVAYEDGVYTIIPWDRVNGMSVHPFRLHFDPHPSVRINWTIADSTKLSTAIRDRVTRSLSDRAFGRIRNGEWARFGDVEISMNGIRYGGKTIPWNEMRSLTIWELTGTPSLSITAYRDQKIVIPLDFRRDLLLLDIIKQLAPRHLLRQSTS